MSTYIDARPEDGKAFYLQYKDAGPITMLNMLRFKTQADYTDLADLQPDQPISGTSAYQTYLDKTLPYLHHVGSEIVYFGSATRYLIGPSDENWDAILLVKHQSVAKFMELANDPGYLKFAGHRTAALDDSRLLPSVPQ